MKKIGLISLALIVALGALGAGYAMWTDTVTVEGPVTTGVVKLGFTGLYGETEPECDGDWEFTDFIPSPLAISCPPGYIFDDEGIHPVEECKDVGEVLFERIDDDEDGVYEKLKITITDAYPYYLAAISTHVINKGTIPIKFKPVVIVQDSFYENDTEYTFVLIQWLEAIRGIQVDPDLTNEMSFYVGVPQHALNLDTGQFDGPLLPENAGRGLPGDPPALSFTITVQGVQWNEYEP